ncbi:MAG: substrate-binding domain-containing protein [Opitutae bacterium]|nr:substrate-binding domain-containing protein [Opitutae bacterium]
MPTTYRSISAQVAAALREGMTTGVWPSVLPGERTLAERLNVSRKTVRRALAILRHEGLIRTERSRASVRTRATPRPEPPRKVALLLPTPLEGARPFTVLWVNRLMSLLHESGLQLEVVSGEKYFGARAGLSLRRLVAEHEARCWILARSHRALQQWFAVNNIPAVVAGSTHTGIDLPSVDIDHRALCRHAATAFLRHGHCRLALFLEKAGHGGDDDSERGFKEGLAGDARAASPLICRPDKSAAAVIHELRRLQALAAPPTGYLLSNSFSYLTVLSYLAFEGLRVPRDVSLISRDEEPFLSHLHPMPTRYAIAPAKFAAALHQTIQRVLERDVAPGHAVRIMPDFVKGDSLARPSAAESGRVTSTPPL